MPKGIAASQNIADLPMKAGADLSTKQYHFVTVDANGKVVATSGLGNKSIGILQDKPNAADQAARVRTISGTTSLLKMAATCNEGDTLTSDANGQGVVVSADLQFASAIALEAAGAIGDLIEVMLVTYVHGQ